MTGLRQTQSPGSPAADSDPGKASVVHRLAHSVGRAVLPPPGVRRAAWPSGQTGRNS